MTKPCVSASFIVRRFCSISHAFFGSHRNIGFNFHLLISSGFPLPARPTPFASRQFVLFFFNSDFGVQFRFFYFPFLLDRKVFAFQKLLDRLLLQFFHGFGFQGPGHFGVAWTAKNIGSKNVNPSIPIAVEVLSPFKICAQWFCRRMASFFIPCTKLK